MQKLKKLIFASLISVICLNEVDAAGICSSSAKAELNKSSAQIRASYTAREEVRTAKGIGEDPYGGVVSNPPTDSNLEFKVDVLDVTLTNITDQFYVEVSNDFDETTKTYTYSDTDNGIITISWDAFYNSLAQVTNFTFKVYATDKTECSGELQRTINLKLPRLNEHYEDPICEGLEEYDLCRKYVTFDYMDNDEFERRVNNYKGKNPIVEEPNEEVKETWQDFIIKNKYYFIGGAVGILVITGVVVAVIVKKRRSSEIV